MSVLPPRLDFKNSGFAFKTIKDRWPVILAQIIDSLYRNRVQLQDVDGLDLEKVKQLTGAIAGLRYEITTDKPLILLKSNIDGCQDLDVWNEYLRSEQVYLNCEDNLKDATTTATWHGVYWLFNECYMYRRIMDCVMLSGLHSFDPFREKKRSALSSCRSLVQQLLIFLSRPMDLDSLVEKKSLFETFVQASLWANEFDLSLNTGELNNVHEAKNGLAEHIRMLEDRLVVNDLEVLWNSWIGQLPITHVPTDSPATAGRHTTAIILDNAGPELLADLCLGEFLIRSGFTNRVCFYPKCYPWFVSDVTAPDIDWLLDDEGLCHGTEGELKDLANYWSQQWRNRFNDGSFAIRNCSFWTLPCAYAELEAVDPALYTELVEGNIHVILFKGDLNYRKLVGDRSWTPDNPVHKVQAFQSIQWGRSRTKVGQPSCPCLQSAPNLGDPVVCLCSTSEPRAPLLFTLRLAKADVAVGVPSNRLQQLVTENKDWWTIGRFGFLQLVSPIRVE